MCSHARHFPSLFSLHCEQGAVIALHCILKILFACFGEMTLTGRKVPSRELPSVAQYGLSASGEVCHRTKGRRFAAQVSLSQDHSAKGGFEQNRWSLVGEK